VKRKKPQSLAEKLVRFLIAETGGAQKSVISDEIYAAMVDVLAAFCMCADEPITAAQDVCGDIQREVTERVVEREG
jgi:hypothetical protein